MDQTCAEQFRVLPLIGTDAVAFEYPSRRSEPNLRGKHPKNPRRGSPGEAPAALQRRRNQVQTSMLSELAARFAAWKTDQDAGAPVPPRSGSAGGMLSCRFLTGGGGSVPDWTVVRPVGDQNIPQQPMSLSRQPTFRQFVLPGSFMDTAAGTAGLPVSGIDPSGDGG